MTGPAVLLQSVEQTLACNRYDLLEFSAGICTKILPTTNDVLPIMNLIKCKK